MILVNGEQQDTLPADDRGLSYGDGVFRTLLVRRGKPVCWQRHYRKLSADCARLRIPCPAEPLLADEVSYVTQGASEGVLKVVVTRGRGARGYAVSPPAQATRILSSGPVPVYPASYALAGVKLRLCHMRLGRQPALAGVKHLNRLESVLARMEWHDPETAEGLLLDQDGNVIEGTMSNIFMLREGMLYTPDLNYCGVAGVTRDRIMALAPGLGLTLQIRAFPLPFLLAAEEVFLCNSVAGVWRVRELGDKTWWQGSLAGTVRRLLDEEND